MSTLLLVAIALGIAALLALTQLRSPRVTGGAGAALPDPGSVYDPSRRERSFHKGGASSSVGTGSPPIHDPHFVSAEDAGWRDDTLVLGFALEGEARAYPLTS